MYPNYPACFVIIRKEDKFLFVFREKTGFMDNMYSLPAGRVDEDEDFLQGAVREAKEEVGITIMPENLRHVYTQHRYTPSSENKFWIDLFFEADEWDGKPTNMEPDKHSKLEWLPIANLPENIMDFQRHALVQLAAGETYGTHGMTN